MSNSTYPCFAETVTEEFVKEQCPERFEALVDYLKGIGIDDLDSVAHGLDAEAGRDEVDDITDEQDKKIKELLEELMDDFTRKTNLSLYIRYHDKQDVGDRADEVDGAFWEVCGVYVFSPAGKKYEDKITRKFWTVYG